LATKKLAVESLQHTVSNTFFTRNFLTKNNMTVVPHPLHFSLFPRLKLKLKGIHSNTNEMIKAESQATLITLTDHDFQDAFKKWQKCCVEGDFFEGDGGRWPKVNF
jgi:hypothetical protein